MELIFQHGDFSVRQWTPDDREKASQLIKQCLEAYGLGFEPQGADLDAIDIEKYYLKDSRGEFWVVTDNTTQKIVGTGGYYEVKESSDDSHTHNHSVVEIRKMYLLPEARGKKLGRKLLEKLEERIAMKGYQKIYVETASVLFEACKLYRSAGYLPVEGVETRRCDQRLYKDIRCSDKLCAVDRNI